MTQLTGLNITNFPLDILYEAGTVFLGSTPFGTTKGPPKFNPNKGYENVEFDGKYTNVKLLDRVKQGNPTISFTMLELGNSTSGAQVATLEPGFTTATVGAVITKTPQPSGQFVANGSYVTDLRVMWERGFNGSATYFAVYFPWALCMKYDLSGQDKKEGLIAVEFEARSLAAGLTAAPYVLEYRTTTP